MPKVFISHSTKDRVYVEEQILPLLQTHGIRVRYCQDDLLPGTHLDRAIEPRATSKLTISLCEMTT